MGILILLFFGAALAFVGIRNAVGRREWIAFHMKWFLGHFVVFYLCSVVIARVMRLMGVHGWWVQYLAFALSAPLMAQVPAFRRSRKVPEGVRRAVIQKHKELTGGFDPATEEVDHLVPFSKGGGHTKDNLWVVPRKVNRSKGNKMPTLEDWWRFTFRRRVRAREEKQL